jgi:hypothetical protein
MVELEANIVIMSTSTVLGILVSSYGACDCSSPKVIQSIIFLRSFYGQDSLIAEFVRLLKILKVDDFSLKGRYSSCAVTKKTTMRGKLQTVNWEWSVTMC